MPSESLHVSVPEELKNQVKEKLEHSSMSYSDLVKSAFENFLKQYNEKIECGNCGGRAHLNALVKTGGECPGCGHEVQTA